MNVFQRFGWPVLILASALVTLLLYSADLQSPVRTLISLWFVLICPGMAYVRLIGLREKFMEWTLAVALSLGLTTMVGMVLVYSGEWTLARVVSSIFAITLGGVVLDVLTWNHRAAEAAAPQADGKG